MSEHIHREADIIQWGRDRNIYGGSTPQRQASKFVEEVVETVVAIAMGDRDEIVDGIGDTIVCLVHQAEFLGLPIAECIEHSYQQIKDRGGEMRSGVFVKEADLATAPPDEGVEPDEAMDREDALQFAADVLDDALYRASNQSSRADDHIEAAIEELRQFQVPGAGLEPAEDSAGPITPEGLEARGFEPEGAFLVRSFSGAAGLCVVAFACDSDGQLMLEWQGSAVAFLPGCRTLGDVDALIRMLEGGE